MNRIHLLNRALEIVDHNLTGDLTVASLAHDLGYSRSALDRLFVETLGDTPARHIRSRRMRAAAYDLVSSRKRIMDIALDYRFDSQEAFTRAFRRAFDRTPNEYRRVAPSASLRSSLTVRPHEFAPSRIRVVQVWQPQ
jgi:AraC family transcriptional regulator